MTATCHAVKPSHPAAKLVICTQCWQPVSLWRPEEACGVRFYNYGLRYFINVHESKIASLSQRGAGPRLGLEQGGIGTANFFERRV